MIKKLEDILEKSKNLKKARLAVASAEDYEVLKAVKDAYEIGVIEPILVGDEKKIIEYAKEIGFDLENIRVISSTSLKESAMVSVKLVSSDEADFVMKGLLDTAILLKEVLNKEYGLRKDSLLSHVMIYEVPNYHKLIMLTDGGMNINPDFEGKKKILKNSIETASVFGLDKIKVACLSAKEKVNEKMPSTIDARKLQEFFEDEKDVIVEGPLAFDLAISNEASKIKNFKSEVSGDVDILLVPNIEMGNGIGKTLTYMANAKSAGVIMGAKKPVVLVSRADTHETKLYSIALGALVANGQ
ncbi:MAG: bifunctional enoyl-CoA hydratase/phosphate acetyltransferase [Peptostreptococcaceae bacterium]|jgi:phosphate butyryltransferase|nr:bifunctional enoyl-CoA hydratase/phosphate acetyltransferase [Peptostreptococcaceae bacterium]